MRTASSTSRPARSIAAALSKSEVDVGALSGHDGVDHPRHVAARQIVCFEAAGIDAGFRIEPNPSLHGHNLGFDDDLGIHLSQTHAYQAKRADLGIGHECLQIQRNVAQEEKEERQHHQQRKRRQNKQDPFRRTPSGKRGLAGLSEYESASVKRSHG